MIQEGGGNHFKFAEDLASYICLKRWEKYRVRLFLVRIAVTSDFYSHVTPGENINQSVSWSWHGKTEKN